MFGLFRRARRLRALGVLGMNARNAEYIQGLNRRERVPFVDDKLLLHQRCIEVGVPTPRIFGVIDRFGDLAKLGDLLAGRDDFVLKPNRGAGGRGIVVLVGRRDGGFVRSGGEVMSLEQVREHLGNILSGFYSLGGLADRVLIQERVRLHRAFGPISYQGIPDIRVLVYKQQPAMAMLRLPTRASGGRANLHQGGIGAGIDLDTGRTHHAVLAGTSIDQHPDTRMPILGRRVPHWPEILELSRRVAKDVGLGYLGVDVVVDAVRGPLLLEANARPGLAIQIANGRGLRPYFDCIDAIEVVRKRSRRSTANVDVPRELVEAHG